MPELKSKSPRKPEPRIGPFHAGVASALFGFALAIISLQIMLGLLHAQLRTEVSVLAHALEGRPGIAPLARSPHSLLNIVQAKTEIARPPTDTCIDEVTGWLGLPPRHSTEATDRMLASAVCQGADFKAAALPAGAGLTILLAKDAGSQTVRLEAVTMRHAAPRGIDVLLSDRSILALAVGIAFSAGIFGYFLRRNHYLAYVDVRDRAFTDELSGALRREQFLANVQQTVTSLREQGGTASVLAIDLDHFKSINDRFGHAAGDEVIRSCGRLLSGAVRDGDVVGRVGGEEFMIMLPNLPKYIAAEVADRLRKQMAAHAYCFDGNDIFVTMSTGVASLMSSDDTASLMDRADRRLYIAKSRGRNAVVWEDDDNHDY